MKGFIMDSLRGNVLAALQIAMGVFIGAHILGSVGLLLALYGSLWFVPCYLLGGLAADVGTECWKAHRNYTEIAGQAITGAGLQEALAQVGMPAQGLLVEPHERMMARVVLALRGLG